MPLAKTILIVDDEEDFLSFLKEALETRGFEVITSTNAVEAGIELASKSPSLILMDLRMSGIDGFQACEAIKRNPATKNIPIIVVSALSDESDMKKAYETGVLEYFVKPINVEKLIEKIKDALNAPK